MTLQNKAYQQTEITFNTNQPAENPKHDIEQVRKLKKYAANERWRLKNLKHVAKMNKLRRLKDPAKYKEMQKKSRKPRDKKAAYQTSRKYCKKFPKKTYCHLLVRRALISGKLIKQPCQHCQNPKSEAHHVDYSKPLDVQWLCKKHHVAWHKLFIPEGGE